MKKTLLPIALGLCLQAFASIASATVLDFESLAHADDQLTEISGSNPSLYMESGFQLLNASAGFGFSTWGSDNQFFTGSTALINDNDAGITVLSQAGGSLFSLAAIDLAPMAPGITEEPITVNFIGTYNDGQTVTQTLNVSKLDGVTHYTFAPSFTNLRSVSWNNDSPYVQFDNINVAAVPEPSALLMMCGGLLALGTLRRRRH